MSASKEQSKPGHSAQPESAPDAAQSGPGQPEEASPAGAPSAGAAQPAQAARAAGQSRPGKHAVSKPGLRTDTSASGQAAGQEPAPAGQQGKGGGADAPIGNVRAAEPDL